MIPSPEDQTKLEHFVHRALRELPDYPAPTSLEQRVQAALARSAAQPWWRRGFAHWPLAARAAFIPLAGGLVALVVHLTGWMTAGLNIEARETLAQPISWLESVLTVASAIGNFFEIILRSIPPLWLYGGLAFCAAMYAALFGLGAAAYRTYQAQR
ncbi:MAG: hypothetical protein ABIQ12_09670 [Opitutaceae bacterium]